MKSFHIKSILLGIGIGIILTSIVSMIFMAGANSNAPKMSDSEIIEKAKSLGLTEPSSIFDGTPEDSKKASADPVVQPQSAIQEISITIEEGDTSGSVGEKLLESGLIDNTKTFESELDHMELTSKIHIGQYKIKKGTDIKGIIKIITN